MTSSFDFDEVDRFVCGTVGPPGQRVFYLQAVSGSTVVTVKAEKQHVAALADYLTQIIASHDLPAGRLNRGNELLEPVFPEWAVGSLMVALNETTGRIVVVAESDVDTEDWDLDEDEDEDEDDPWDEEPFEESGDGGVNDLRVALSRNQVESFIAAARELMAGGRPPCRLCGRPMDPDGHVCPRWN